MKIPTLHFPIV